jgi:hypothetical protein
MCPDFGISFPRKNILPLLELPNSPDLNRFRAFTVLQTALVGKPDLEVSTG